MHSDAMQAMIDSYLEDLRHFGRNNFQANVRSLELYAHWDRLEDEIRRFLGRKRKMDFSATNHYANLVWVPALLGSVLSRLEETAGVPLTDPREPLPIACAMVTFTHRVWNFPDTAIKFDLTLAKRKVRNALNGTNFVARFEPAVYSNVKWERDGQIGSLVSFHAHALCWANNKTKIARAISRVRPRFIPSLGNRSGVNAKRLKTPDDVVHTLVYIGKMPNCGYAIITRRGGKISQCKSKIKFISRYRLFEALKSQDIRAFWLAGGEGAVAMKHARNSLTRKRSLGGSVDMHLQASRACPKRRS